MPKCDFKKVAKQGLKVVSYLQKQVFCSYLKRLKKVFCKCSAYLQNTYLQEYQQEGCFCTFFNVLGVLVILLTIFKIS